MSNKDTHRRKSVDCTDNKYVHRDISNHFGFQYHATYYTTPEGYEVWQDRTGGGSADVVRVHRLVAVAEYGFDAVADKHVHHRNNTPWDNRPDNLELKTPAEHTKHHHRIDDEELLEDLRIGAVALGRTPRPIDMNAFGEYSSQTYNKRFGSWEAALEEAGLDE